LIIIYVIETNKDFFNIFICPFLVIGSIFIIFTTGPIEWVLSIRCLAKFDLPFAGLKFYFLFPVLKFDLLFPVLKSLKVFFVSSIK
jgi:hypothetical protein